MSDIKFECPHCRQHLDVPEAMLGTIAECPSCIGSFQLPHPVANYFQVENTIQLQTAQRSTLGERSIPDKSSDIQQCPFCGETILKIAIKCKHCGSFLEQRATGLNGANGGFSNGLPVFSKPAGSIGGMGWALILIPFIVGFVCDLIMLGLIVMNDDTDNFINCMLWRFFAGLIPVLVVTILITIEAVQVGAGGTNDLNPNGTRREGPVLWFITGLLFFIVAYPWWMKRRSVYGLRNLRGYAILSIVAWILAAPILASIVFSLCV